ncbi:MAG: choice-of-anchor Q domain-containing protein [Potamolinea sp.]
MWIKRTFTNNRASQGGATYTKYSDLTVTNSTFTGNNSSGSGGAIFYLGANGDTGKIILRANTFTNNTAVNSGGAIYSQLYNRETSLIDNNTFSGNSISSSNSGRGGAIYNVSSIVSGLPGFTGGTNSTVLTITNSTFSANTATFQGGGLFDSGATTVNITNSTFSGNKATAAYGEGGAIWKSSAGKINITNSTIANNTAGNSGGGIFGGGSTSKLTNTIIANNVANNASKTQQNCSSALTNGGNNLQFSSVNPNSNECGSAIQWGDPLLGALANNGGRTQTMLLLSGSPAINAGNNATCPTTDQRSILRSKGDICDIGAVEMIP